MKQLSVPVLYVQQDNWKPFLDISKTFHDFSNIDMNRIVRSSGMIRKEVLIEIESRKQNNEPLFFEYEESCWKSDGEDICSGS